MNIDTAYCPSACVWKCKKKLYCKYHDCIMYLTVTKCDKGKRRSMTGAQCHAEMPAHVCISKDLAQDMPHSKTITVSLNAFHNSETE